jgi:hypothetical protein
MPFNKYMMEKFTDEIQTNVLELMNEISTEHNIPYEKLEQSLTKFFGDMTISKKKKKVTKTNTKEKKEKSDEERCVALTKTKDRCKGTKCKTGNNPDFCHLHQSKGATNGIYSESKLETIPEVELIPLGAKEEDTMDKEDIEKYLTKGISFD